MKAADSQKAAQSAITKTQDNIKMAEDLLNQVSLEKPVPVN